MRQTPVQPLPNQRIEDLGHYGDIPLNDKLVEELGEVKQPEILIDPVPRFWNKALTPVVSQLGVGTPTDIGSAKSVCPAGKEGLYDLSGHRADSIRPCKGI